ncbi:MAG: substrate-binding domain-containing protein [Ruminococcus sp.]
MCKSGSGTYPQPCPRCTAFSLCLYEYSIGLYVPSGNPLKLSGLMDFACKDIKIANREKGSTPRIYLDQFLFSEKNFASQHIWLPY